MDTVLNISNDDALVIAQAGLLKFFSQRDEVKTVRLIHIVLIGGLLTVKTEYINGRTIFLFDIEASDGKKHRCKCNVATFSLIMTIVVLGQSVFIDYEGAKTHKPYLKVCGRMSSSAGIMLGRIIDASTPGRNATYANGDTLDLTYENILEI